MEGLIFNIQKFCINDGPGIRTTVFFKGCPLRCRWCHNPESHKALQELLYDPGKCVGCGRCVEACPAHAHEFADGQHIFHREKCEKCGKCLESCYYEALEMAGKYRTVEDVLQEVMKDKIFYDNSGGGMTLSGGEPLMQFDFALALLQGAKERGLHTCMETCGYAEEEKLREIAPYVDIFLFDIKLTDSEKHRFYTGVGNERIRENLRILDALGKQTVLRCPIIPGVNDDEGHLAGIGALADSLENVLGVEVEPYHSLGTGKDQRLGRTDSVSFPLPEPAQVEQWVQTIQKHTKVSVKKA